MNPALLAVFGLLVLPTIALVASGDALAAMRAWHKRLDELESRTQEAKKALADLRRQR